MHSPSRGCACVWDHRSGFPGCPPPPAGVGEAGTNYTHLSLLLGPVGFRVSLLLLSQLSLLPRAGGWCSCLGSHALPRARVRCTARCTDAHIKRVPPVYCLTVGVQVYTCIPLTLDNSLHSLCTLLSRVGETYPVQVCCISRYSYPEFTNSVSGPPRGSEGPILIGRYRLMHHRG